MGHVERFGVDDGATPDLERRCRPVKGGQAGSSATE